MKLSASQLYALRIILGYGGNGLSVCVALDDHFITKQTLIALKKRGLIETQNRSKYEGTAIVWDLFTTIHLTARGTDEAVAARDVHRQSQAIARSILKKKAVERSGLRVGQVWTMCGMEGTAYEESLIVSISIENEEVTYRCPEGIEERTVSIGQFGTMHHAAPKRNP